MTCGGHDSGHHEIYGAGAAARRGQDDHQQVPNRSPDDAISMALHTTLSHQQNLLHQNGPVTSAQSLTED